MFEQDLWRIAPAIANGTMLFRANKCALILGAEGTYLDTVVMTLVW